MSILLKKRQLLAVLVENINNPHPQVVPSEMIASKLDMSLKDTCHLLKIMHEMGVVICDAAGQSALITREGLNCLNQ